MLSSLVVAAVLAAPQAPVPQKPKPHRGTLVVEAARIHIAPDTVLKDSAILVRNGKVLYVGSEIPADARKGATLIRFPKGTVMPGMINPHSSLGHGNQLAERIDTFTPELQASDAFDPFIEPLRRSAHAGVTTVGLAPSSYNAFAGQGAAVRTGDIGQVLVDSTYLKMSMVDAAFDQNRFPTSRMGACDLIRNAFKRARSPLGATDPRLKILQDVANGNRMLALHAETEGELDCVLDLCAEIQVKPLLVGCTQAHKVVDRIAKVAKGVVLQPLSFGSSKQRLGLPARLEKLGVPFSFMAERPEHLRISAALAVRHGASKKAVLRALTETAASHADCADRAGTLRQGRSADFCVFSGDPLDLTSRLLKVYIAGLPQQAKAPTK